MKTADENEGMGQRKYHWQDWEQWAEAQRPHWQAQLNETRRIYRSLTNCSPSRHEFMAPDVAAYYKRRQDDRQARTFLAVITAIGLLLALGSPVIGAMVLQ